MAELGQELLIESRRRTLVALRAKKESARGVLQGEMIPCGNYLKCGTLMVVGPRLFRLPYLIQRRELIPPICIASSE
jgi:hypothetical protein